MQAFTRALRAETLKIKGTLALWLVLLTPAALVFLEVAAAAQQQGNLLKAGGYSWLYMFEHLFSIWVILVLPLFITLETALLGQLEHRSNTWKLTYSQPVPRWAILAAKQVWGMGLVALGMLALILLTLAGSLILNLIIPELQLTLPLPWREMFSQAGIAFLASGIILAVHTWIALRSRSFVVASAVGIGMTIAGLILAGLDWTQYFPWTMPGMALNNYYDGAAFGVYLAAGSLGWLVLSILANLEVGRLEIGK